MFYVHSLTSVVRWLAIGVVSIDLGLVVYILFRRAWRNRYYARKDAALSRSSATITAFLAGRLTTARAVEKLSTRTRAEREAIEVLLLGALNGTARKPATELLLALGYVERWSRQAFGPRRTPQLVRFAASSRSSALSASARGRMAKARRLRVFAVSRAVAVGRLGRLSPEISGVFMRAALRDPSPYVGRLGVAAMGRNPIPDGTPVLLEQLREAVAGATELPVRSIKTALVRYPVQELRHFTTAMRNSNPRFRFLAVDTVREICRKARPADTAPAEFPPELREWFLHNAVTDPAPDVRARSAAVISTFRTAEAAEALRRLLHDEDEFVRLHAVRACAVPCYPGLIPDIVQRITDPKWRVREAAVRALAAFSADGRKQLAQFFLETHDRYASEQIADELQRSGMLSQIVSALGSPNGERGQAFEVCAKMAALGMDSALAGILAEDGRTQVRVLLLEALGVSNSSQFLTALQRIAAKDTDPLQLRAAHMLRSRTPRTAAAAGKQD